MIPLAFMGEGMVNLLALMSAMLVSPGGIFLVDEIENGFHYSVLPDVWRVLGESARRANVQIFATTHSFECIRAAHEAFSQSSYDFRYHRLDRVNGDTLVKMYDRETLEAAVGAGFEMR